MEFYCDICDYTAKTKSNLINHNKTKKHQLISEKLTSKLNIFCKKKENKLYECENCQKNFKHDSSYYRHKKSCNNKKNNICELKLKLEFAEKEKELYQKLEKEKTELLNMAMNNASNKINQLIDNNRSLLDTIHYIDNNESDSDFDNHIVKTINDNNLLSEKSKTLILNNVTIVSRSIDNYINATQLCKAGNKKFSHWISLDTTKELISVLASDAGITASELVDLNKGGNCKNQDSWIHPDLAIQLAQWLSPNFALQVSKWIRTLFSNSKVEVSLKLLKDKEKELEVKNKKIKLLENLHLKKQKREEYPESNVIYILTTKENKNNRIYIVGKAKDLKTRLSTYNKTAEHEVIYYKGCKNEDNMNIIEQIVLNKLNNYREQANRDRFILPENQNISLFKNIIDNSIKFFE